eukprot:5301320-Pyramimonas_sp.AAC.1
MGSEISRGKYHRQQLRLPRRLRGHETQPPAGIGILDVEGGGLTACRRGDQLHVDESGMRRRLGTRADCTGVADGIHSVAAAIQ